MSHRKQRALYSGIKLAELFANSHIERREIMKRKPFVSVLFLAVAALALNGAPSWAQSEGSKEKSVGGTRSERSGSETETPLPKGSPSAGSTEPSKAGRASGGASDPSKAGQGARSASQGMGQQDIREAQEALKSQGHDPGPIDGVMGSQTRQALREFQSKNGLKQTGNLDAETKQKLNIEGSSSGSPSGKGSGAMGKGDSPSRQKEPSSSPMGK